ncbi:MAG TPA: S24 family peptidase [Rubrivivax sp.]|nr:S24 family peptidase [Rubrivivax sp.]
MSCACQGPSEPRADDDCSGGESFALRVLGDSMLPEFHHGDIIIIEPDGALHDGCYVLARLNGEHHFRQLLARGDGWVLHALNPVDDEAADLPLPGLHAVRGVVFQKAVPGRRHLSRSYLGARR